MTLKQLQSIKRIIKIIGLKNTNPKAILVVKSLLNKNTNGKERKDDSFYYRSTIRSLLYLAGYTRPNILMVVYQAAKFLNDLKVSHNTAVKRISKYLLSNKDKGLICKLYIN